MSSIEFLPFYERLLLKPLRNIVGKTFVSVLLGLVFLAAQYFTLGSKIFTEWWWFLSLLISTAMLSLYYATFTLNTILPEMTLRLGDDKIFLTPLKTILSDRNMILAGIFFGLLNCGFGYSFGPPDYHGMVIVSTMGGYFLAGFVCGMAVFGIYGVSVSIIAFAGQAKSSFDFTAPDHCGGTLFIGDGLVVFSSVTLIVGVMISIYILKTPWTQPDTWWITTLKFSWIAFPYLASLLALFAPAVPINTSLREFKMEKDAIIQSRQSQIRAQLEKNDLAPERRHELRDDYEFQRKIREELHQMRTWPFGLGTNLKYVTVIMINLSASLKPAWGWVQKFFNLTGA